MKAKDALILWTPDREGVAEPTRGEIKVVGFPDEKAVRDYAEAGGAVEAHWRETSDETRLFSLLAYFNMITVYDNIRPRLVHEAFEQIDEYRRLHRRDPADDEDD